MDAISLIAIMGTIASIGGAGVSIWQAKRSKSAADEVKQVRAQLLDHRNASELAQLQIVCKKAQKSMEKYGPGSVPESLHGVSPEKDAQEVQEFLLLMKEHRGHFGTKPPNLADDFCKTLQPALNEFAKAQKPEELRQNGMQVLIHLNNMTPIIKGHLDTKRERIH